MTRQENGTPIRLLIIDDDNFFTDMIEFTLQQKGFEVTVFNSSLDGIEAARHLNPDVILLDLMMPGMDGWQVCKEIRGFSNVPVLVMSAIVDSQLVVRALDAGADDYLIKPSPEGVLAARLERLVQQAKNG